MYACPKCGDSKRLDVCADIWVRLVQDDSENIETDADEAEEHGHTWDENHGMICRSCGHGGNVSGFEVEE